MKINRNKKSHKILTFFATNFNYHEPYQILIDATFCQAALQNKVSIEEQLKRYFQCELKFVTTQCIILEVESLGTKLTGAAQIVKRFPVHKCGHEGKPVGAALCIKSMTKESRYIVASQDRSIQSGLRKVPGRCLLYLHKSTPVLEAPSPASKKYVTKKANNLLPEKEEKKIEFLKEKHGLKVSTNDKPKRKPKGPKNPNPLSCKKSKKVKSVIEKKIHSKLGVDEKSKTAMKPKRKRIKIPVHIKEALKSTNS